MLAAPIENRIFFGQIKFLLLGTMSGKGVSNGMSREHKADEEGSTRRTRKEHETFQQGLEETRLFHDRNTTWQ